MVDVGAVVGVGVVGGAFTHPRKKDIRRIIFMEINLIYFISFTGF